MVLRYLAFLAWVVQALSATCNDCCTDTDCSHLDEFDEFDPWVGWVAGGWVATKCDELHCSGGFKCMPKADRTIDNKAIPGCADPNTTPTCPNSKYHSCPRSCRGARKKTTTANGEVVEVYDAEKACTKKPVPIQTGKPTPQPTKHGCDDGAHGCTGGGQGGLCVLDDTAPGQFKCTCAEGYVCKSGCNESHASGSTSTNHVCEATQSPTLDPTPEPTAEPTVEPTPEPTEEPTYEPSAMPTEYPTPEPTVKPTFMPTPAPTAEPTKVPTAEPTNVPSGVPTAMPTAAPTALVPTEQATATFKVDANDPNPTAANNNVSGSVVAMVGELLGIASTVSSVIFYLGVTYRRRRRNTSRDLDGGTSIEPGEATAGGTPKDKSMTKKEAVEAAEVDVVVDQATRTVTRATP